MPLVPAGHSYFEDRSLRDVLLSLDGEISRNQFVYGLVVLLVIDAILTLFMMFLLGVPIGDYFVLNRGVATAKLISYAALALPYFALTVKRLRARRMPSIAAAFVLMTGFFVGVEGYHGVIPRVGHDDLFAWLTTAIYMIGVVWLFIECGILPERRPPEDDEAD